MRNRSVLATTAASRRSRRLALWPSIAEASPQVERVVRRSIISRRRSRSTARISSRVARAATSTGSSRARRCNAAAATAKAAECARRSSPRGTVSRRTTASVSSHRGCLAGWITLRAALAWQRTRASRPITPRARATTAIDGAFRRRCSSTGITSGRRCHNGNGRRQAAAVPRRHCEDCHGIAFSPVLRVDHLQVFGVCSSCHNGTIARGQHAGPHPDGQRMRRVPQHDGVSAMRLRASAILAATADRARRARAGRESCDRGRAARRVNGVATVDIVLSCPVEYLDHVPAAGPEVSVRIGLSSRVRRGDRDGYSQRASRAAPNHGGRDAPGAVRYARWARGGVDCDASGHRQRFVVRQGRARNIVHDRAAGPLEHAAARTAVLCR